MKQKYLVLIRMASDTEVWLPGSMIELDEVKSAIHLAAGNVALLEGTTPPPVTPPVIVHEPVVVATKGGE
jgi:hypothetical protein